VLSGPGRAADSAAGSSLPRGSTELTDGRTNNEAEKQFVGAAEKIRAAPTIAAVSAQTVFLLISGTRRDHSADRC
jgi:hypothetical protein